jgi:hypothetical protein
MDMVAKIPLLGIKTRFFRSPVCSILMIERVAILIILKTRIQELIGSILGRDTDYSD